MQNIRATTPDRKVNERSSNGLSSPGGAKPKLLDQLSEVLRARKPKRLPVVMTREEVKTVRNEILVRDGKGAKERITMLPESLKTPLHDHLKQVKAIHERDLSEGWGRVGTLDRKYPNAPAE